MPQDPGRPLHIQHGCQALGAERAARTLKDMAQLSLDGCLKESTKRLIRVSDLLTNKRTHELPRTIATMKQQIDT